MSTARAHTKDVCSAQASIANHPSDGDDKLSLLRKILRSRDKTIFHDIRLRPKTMAGQWEASAPHHEEPRWRMSAPVTMRRADPIEIK